MWPVLDSPLFTWEQLREVGLGHLVFVAPLERYHYFFLAPFLIFFPPIFKPFYSWLLVKP